MPQKSSSRLRVRKGTGSTSEKGRGVWQTLPTIEEISARLQSSPPHEANLFFDLQGIPESYNRHERKEIRSEVHRVMRILDPNGEHKNWMHLKNVPKRVNGLIPAREIRLYTLKKLTQIRPKAKIKTLRRNVTYCFIGETLWCYHGFTFQIGKHPVNVRVPSIPEGFDEPLHAIFAYRTTLAAIKESM